MTPVKGRPSIGGRPGLASGLASSADTNLDSTLQTVLGQIPTDAELKELRFPNERTAFDIEMDSKLNQPWKITNNPAEYFNYDFTEDTWKVRIVIVQVLARPFLSIYPSFLT